MTEEAVVFIDDQEIKVSELSDQQKYLHSQLLDLRNKEASLKFQLDQVAASMSVFQNESTKKELTTATKAVGSILT
jgi:hypothetical protein